MDLFGLSFMPKFSYIYHSRGGLQFSSGGGVWCENLFECSAYVKLNNYTLGGGKGCANGGPCLDYLKDEVIEEMSIE